MSYTTNITEELTIRNTSAKTRHIVWQIFNYLQQLDSMYNIRRFHIIHAALEADGECIEVHDQWKDEDGLFRVEYDESGKETRIYWREDVIPSEYYGLINSAAGLRRNFPPLLEPPKEVKFRIDYFCECTIGQIGIEFWRNVFEAMDDEELRANVRYICVQDNDACEETAFTYRYDACGFGEVPYQDGLDAIADTGDWAFDLYTYAVNEERKEGTPEQKEADDRLAAEINAYAEKYDLYFEPELSDEIAIEWYYECAASEVPRLMKDVQQMMRTLSENGYDPMLTHPHAVCRDRGKLAAIRFEYDVLTGTMQMQSVRL